MVLVSRDDHEQVKRLLDEEGQVRKNELEELVETSAHLDHHLMLLVKDGDAAIFPVGEVVIVRPE
jgi:hypothetical protein